MALAADSASNRFSGLLVQFRGRTGLTQRELASRVGAGRRVVQDWEAGVNVPSADRLQTLIAVLVQAGGLTVGRESIEAHTLWAAALSETSSRLRNQMDEKWLDAVLQHHASGVPPEQPAGDARRQDWGEAPDVIGFVGRSTELETCRRWLLEEGCHVVAVLGMGGIGKTVFAARLAQDVGPTFRSLYWRSLRDAPTVSEWLAGAIGFLSAHRLAPPPTESERLTALLQLLRERRSLLVLDNFETLLEPGRQLGGYRAESTGFGRLLEAVGDGRHQSCLVLTSRELPPELIGLDGAPVSTLDLGGLQPTDSQALLAHNQLAGNSEEWTELTTRFGGNGLALKIVGERIRQLFAGDIGAFLKQETGSATVFGGIRRLLDEQIARSSAMELDVLRVLAVEREPLSLAELLAAFGGHVGHGQVLDAVEAVRRRSLVERVETDVASAFTLQSVVLEYVIDRLTQAVIEEIDRCAPGQLATRPLIKAKAKDYVRHAQERLIGAPILQRLIAQHGESETKHRLLALLNSWRGRSPEDQGYGPGNVVNLLRLLRNCDLRGVDLSHISARQVYLAGVSAEDASLAGAHLRDAVLADAFRPPHLVALSGDGALMAVGTSNGEIWLFNVADRTPLLAIQGHTRAVFGVALTADGRLLASGGADGKVRLWAVPSGQLLATLEGQPSLVYGVALSANGRVVASSSADGAVRLCELPSGRVLTTLHGHTGLVYSVALSADGRLLASSSADSTVRLWDVQSGRLLAILQGHTSAVWGVALTPDGQLLGSASEDGTVRLWEVPSGRPLSTLTGHTGGVWGVALSADGRLVASSSGDCTVRLWEAPSGRPRAVLHGHASLIWGVAFSADTRLLASSSADGTVRLWEVASGRSLATLQGVTGAVFGVAIAANGQLLASSNANGSINLWELPSGRALSSVRSHPSASRPVALSPDGQLLAAGGIDGTLRFWAVPGGRSLATLDGHSGAIFALAFAAKGELLASSSADGTIRLWHVPSGQLLATLRGHTSGVRGVALSMDGSLVASGSDDGTVRLWEAPSGRSLATLEGHHSGVWRVALAADGRLLASGGDDGTVRLWEVPSGRPLAALQGHSSTVLSVSMSADGHLVASGGGDGTVRLWEAASGRPLATLHGHTSIVLGVVVSPDGRLVASGGGDGVVKLWSTDSGTCLATLQGEPCYSRMDITGLTGVTPAQRAALVALGAVEHPAG